MSSGSPGKSSRSEVAEWEEPRHPGPAVRWGSYPTLSHSATQLSSFVPQSLRAVRKVTVCPCKRAGFPVGEVRPLIRCDVQFSVQETGLQPELQSAGLVPTLVPCLEPAYWSSPACF